MKDTKLKIINNKKHYKYNIYGKYNTCEIDNPDYQIAAAICMFGGLPYAPFACLIAWNTPPKIWVNDSRCGYFPFTDEKSDQYESELVDKRERIASIYEDKKILKFKYFTNGNRSIVFETEDNDYFQIGAISRAKEYIFRISEKYAWSYDNYIYGNYILLKDLNDRREIQSLNQDKGYNKVQKNVCY